MARVYLEDQIYNLKQKEKSQQGGKRLLMDSLDGYVNSDYGLASSPGDDGTKKFGTGAPMITQSGDNVLDRLVALANENQDVKYRKDITKKIVAAGQQLLENERETSFYTDLLPKKIDEIPETERERILARFTKIYQSAKEEAAARQPSEVLD